MWLERVKRWLGQAAFGAVLALAAAIALGPGFISWRYEAPGQESLSCGPAVRTALSSYARLELYAAGVGAVIGLALTLVMDARKPGKAKTEPLPPA